MGFGTLFIGYLISINTIAAPGFTKILAYLVMLMATVRLSPFNRHLKKAHNVLLPTVFVGVGYLFVEAGALFSLFPTDLEESLILFSSLLTAVFELVFLIHLLRGLQELAVETDVKILEIAAFRNRIFTFCYYTLYLIDAAFALSTTEYSAGLVRFLGYYAFAVLLIGFVVMLMNAKLFYNFYMWICLPEDIAMERKPSRFALINKIRTYFDGVEERQLERRRERDAAYQKSKKRKEKTKKK